MEIFKIVLLHLIISAFLTHLSFLINVIVGPIGFAGGFANLTTDESNIQIKTLLVLVQSPDPPHWPSKDGFFISSFSHQRLPSNASHCIK